VATETLQIIIWYRKIDGIFQAFMAVKDNVVSAFGRRPRVELY
jgi:hypothetical protein